MKTTKDLKATNTVFLRKIKLWQLNLWMSWEPSAFCLILVQARAKVRKHGLRSSNINAAALIISTWII